MPVHVTKSYLYTYGCNCNYMFVKFQAFLVFFINLLLAFCGLLRLK